MRLCFYTVVAFFSAVLGEAAVNDLLSKFSSVKAEDMAKMQDTLLAHHPELSSRLELLKECPPDQYSDCLLHLIDDDSIRTEINDMLHVTKLVNQDASQCTDEECRRQVLKNSMPNVMDELKKSMGNIAKRKGIPEYDLGALDNLFDLLHRTEL